MRRLVGPALIVLLLTACGGPFAGGFGDGAPTPTPLSVPLAAGLATPLATATRGTPGASATATRVTPAANATATRPVATSTTPVRATPATPIPVRPGPPVVGTASPAAIPTRTGGTPGTPIPIRPGPPATPRIAGTPGVAGTPRISGTLGTAATPRVGTPTASPVAASGTTIQLFAPYRPGGLASGLRVEASVNGYCWVGAETLPGRPDAWRCTANNRIYDPCFAADSPDTTPLACAADPWAGTVTLLTLTAPLPRDRANTAAGTTRNPWAIQLANGARCQAIAGASATIAGMRIGMACSDGSQIVGDPDRSGGRWRVYILRDGDPSLTTEEIVTAWY